MSMVNKYTDATYVPAEFVGPLMVLYGAEATLKTMTKAIGTYSWLSDGSLALTKKGSMATVAPVGGVADVQIAVESRRRSVTSRVGATTAIGDYGVWGVVETTVKRIASGNVYEVIFDQADYRGVVDKKCTSPIASVCTWFDYQYRFRVVLVNFVAGTTPPVTDGGNGYSPGDGGYTPPPPPPPPEPGISVPWVPIAVVGGVGVTVAVLAVVLLRRKGSVAPASAPT